MCGIVGVVHRDPNRPVDAALIQRMCGLLRHRGPDSAGLTCRGPAALGATRLAIIDVAAGHQPIVNERDTAAIAFNGEAYNHRTLRAELHTRGHRFATQCDTETVLHLCEEYGADAPHRIRGMFAFAFWDDVARELLLARDRFGIKPLYYVSGDWGIGFASELKVLVQAGFSARRLDLEALDAYLELGYIPAPLTPFDDIRKLPAAHVLRWRHGAMSITPYWELPAPDPSRRVVPADVNQWIDDTVAAHLESDVPVAAYLSGGLDSSAVVASMALRAERPHAFVARYIGTGGDRVDESPLAGALAARYGARLTVVDVAPPRGEEFAPIVHALDEPHADDSCIPSWALARAVARDYKVALCGIGGDELFAGYRRHIGILAGSAYRWVPAGGRAWLARCAAQLPEPVDGHAAGRVKRFLAAGAGSTADRYLAYVSRLRADERRALCAPALAGGATPDAAARIFARHAASARSSHPLTLALHLDYNTFLPDDVLALADRISMAHGLEVRVPLVDDRLVDAVFPLSPWLKVGPWRRKWLLRRALRHRLPDAHLRAPKLGFTGPTGSWLRHELRELLTDELAESRMRRLGLFDARVVTGLLDDHLRKRRDREGILWALLTFVTWHRLYVEEPAAASPVSAAPRTIVRSRAGKEAGRTT